MSVIRILRKIDELYFRAKVDLFFKMYGLSFVTECLMGCLYHRRIYLLKKYGTLLGANVNLSGPVIIDNQEVRGDFSNLEIGDNSYIGKNVYFDLTEKLIIKDSCAISCNVTFLTHGDPGRKRPLASIVERREGGISIGRGTWIGAKCIILPGISIGESCVIGAGTVITKNVPSHTRIIAKISYDEKNIN